MDPQSVDIAKLNAVSYENTIRRSIFMIFPNTFIHKVIYTDQQKYQNSQQVYICN